MAWFGTARQGEAWQGKVSTGGGQFFFKAWPGQARFGTAWQGRARLGAAWQGLVSKKRGGQSVFFTQRGEVRQGAAGQGTARLGLAWQGVARSGKAWFQPAGRSIVFFTWRGEARRGRAWSGEARQGKAGRGKARRGKARITPKKGAPLTRLHPLFKDVARLIADDERVFYSDEDLAALLEESIGSMAYDFARMNLANHLLDEYGIDFIRAEAIEEHSKRKGYKIATPVETVRITAPRLQNRIRNAARKQRKALSVVDYGALPAAVKKEYDARVIRGGLLAAFLAQTPLRQCVPGVKMRIDRPKIIKR
jgi:hypothetical protein